MLLGIDHLAIAVADPDAAIAELAAFLGMPAGSSGGRHPAWGTRNRLLWLGDTYIELCTVDDPALARDSWLGRPALDVLPGPAAICWALASDNIDADREALNARGAQLGAPIRGQRTRPDGRIVRWTLALPSEVALGRPFLIWHDPTAAEWSEGDRAGRAAEPGRLATLELPVDGIDGLPVDGNGPAMRVGSQTVRLAGSRLDPVLRLTGLGRAAVVTLLGCEWHLE